MSEDLSNTVDQDIADIKDAIEAKKQSQVRERHPLLEPVHSKHLQVLIKVLQDIWADPPEPEEFDNLFTTRLTEEYEKLGSSRLYAKVNVGSIIIFHQILPDFGVKRLVKAVLESLDYMFGVDAKRVFVLKVLRENARQMCKGTRVYKKNLTKFVNRCYKDGKYGVALYFSDDIDYWNEQIEKRRKSQEGRQDMLKPTGKYEGDETSVKELIGDEVELQKVSNQDE